MIGGLLSGLGAIAFLTFVVWRAIKTGEAITFKTSAKREARHTAFVERKAANAAKRQAIHHERRIRALMHDRSKRPRAVRK